MFAIVIAGLFLCQLPHSNSFGPLIKETKGEVWPKPQNQNKTELFFTVDPLTFTFNIPDISCPNIVQDAVNRYTAIIQSSHSNPKRKTADFTTDPNYLGAFESLNLDVQCSSDSLRPLLGDIENYTLTITANERNLSSKSVWGLLRGLETFSQLLYQRDGNLLINTTTIDDFPLFPYRGLLLDTARHYQPLYIIYTMLDAMAYNKLNVFHWHLTDDQSFPYESIAFPELSKIGAYSASETYSQGDIASVIEYARLRGIRVLAEFDVPGHTGAWGASHPEILSKCYDENGDPNGSLGPMNPTLNSTYELLFAFIDEVVGVFPDAYLHVGGDEVDFTCWWASQGEIKGQKSDAAITAFMDENKITSYEALQSYFMNKVVDYLASKKTTPIVWEEAFLNGVVLQDFSAIVQVWRADNSLDTLSQVTAADKLAVYSSCWYLDHLTSGWEIFYQCDPLAFGGSDLQKRAVLGGEACMWAEVVNEYNAVARVWPRASAVAERLWSTVLLSDLNGAKSRLEEQTCRMNARGIGAQPPNGPGVCP